MDCRRMRPWVAMRGHDGGGIIVPSIVVDQCRCSKLIVDCLFSVITWMVIHIMSFFASCFIGVCGIVVWFSLCYNRYRTVYPELAFIGHRYNIILWRWVVGVRHLGEESSRVESVSRHTVPHDIRRDDIMVPTWYSYLAGTVAVCHDARWLECFGVCGAQT
jgi:hypothetical protein